MVTSLGSLLSAVVPIWRLGVTMPGRLVIIDKDLRCVALRAAARRGPVAGRRGGVGGQRNAHLSMMPWRCLLAVPGLLALFIRRAYMPANQRAVRTLYASVCKIRYVGERVVRCLLSYVCYYL